MSSKKAVEHYGSDCQKQNEPFQLGEGFEPSENPGLIPPQQQQQHPSSLSDTTAFVDPNLNFYSFPPNIPSHSSFPQPFPPQPFLPQPFPLLQSTIFTANDATVAYQVPSGSVSQNGKRYYCHIYYADTKMTSSGFDTKEEASRFLEIARSHLQEQQKTREEVNKMTKEERKTLFAAAKAKAELIMTRTNGGEVGKYRSHDAAVERVNLLPSEEDHLDKKLPGRPDIVDLGISDSEDESDSPVMNIVRPSNEETNTVPPLQVACNSSNAPQRASSETTQISTSPSSHDDKDIDHSHFDERDSFENNGGECPTHNVSFKYTSVAVHITAHGSYLTNPILSYDL